jgi:hypothetical protein
MQNAGGTAFLDPTNLDAFLTQVKIVSFFCLINNPIVF